METIYIKEKDYQVPCDLPIIAAEKLFGLPVYPDFEGTIQLRGSHTCPFWVEECDKKDCNYAIRVRTKSFTKTFYFKRVIF